MTARVKQSVWALGALLLLAASTVFVMTNTVLAADLVAKARPAPAYDPCGVARFTGFYAGGNVGAVAYTANRGDRDEYFNSAEFSAQTIGATAGVQAGYDWQSCNKVFGVVADWNWAGAKANTQIFPSDQDVQDMAIRNRMDWFSTIRARAGLAVNDTLFYVTGGVAAAKIKTDLVNRNSFDAPEQFAFSGVRWGFVGGVGAEFALGDHWSVNAELLYMQFNKDTDTFNALSRGNRASSFENNDSAFVGRVGLNYRFDNPRVAQAASGAALSYPCGPARFGGLYAGGTIGGVSATTLQADRDSYLSLGDKAATDTGVTVGGQVGYDWQSCNKLLGIVADWNWTDVAPTAREQPNAPGVVDSSVRSKMDWFATLRGRAGLVVDDTLVYVTGGVAAAKIGTIATSQFINLADPPFSFGDTRLGLVGGIGAEFALGNNWSVNGELLYMQFRKETAGPFRSTTFGNNFSFDSHDSAWVSRLGLNYRFDNPAGVAAKSAAAPCSPARFSGGYVGGNTGAIYRTARTYDQDGLLPDPAPLAGTEGGATAGGQIGFDWQSCNKVIGVVADWSWAGADTEVPLFPNIAVVTDASVRSKMDWFSTIRARAGLAVGDALVYVTGGVAAANVESTVTGRGTFINEQHAFSDTRWGWVGGAGAEFALANGWSVNGEVLYMQFRKDTGTAHSPIFGRPVSFEHNDSAWVGRVGLNYRWGDAGAVAATY